jgi:hypothetical protein
MRGFTRPASGYGVLKKFISRGWKVVNQICRCGCHYPYGLRKQQPVFVDGLEKQVVPSIVCRTFWKAHIQQCQTFSKAHACMGFDWFSLYSLLDFTKMVMAGSLLPTEMDAVG